MGSLVEVKMDGVLTQKCFCAAAGTQDWVSGQEATKWFCLLSLFLLLSLLFHPLQLFVSMHADPVLK